ncbi:hypothetical protein HHK36_007622 [Tetracentron sinense]|uniref:GRAM domain-containing protein n=1 Tax=Tetracentron sinense TaxID=13715 RepID=A0A835DLG6_TETSI|nr:hypothetical protein HHK36_007622 [Tetracentron sinense]
MNATTEETQPQQASSSSPATREAEPCSSLSTTEETQSRLPSPESDEGVEKWGTHIMGPPAVPTSHPNNQKAALWSVDDQQQHTTYLQCSLVNKPTTNPIEPVLYVFNSWSRKAETMARNIWQNLKTGSSVSGAAWGKVNLTAKAITEGGFESLYKHTFTTDPNEKLKKTFACYLSTATGPVAGTLYLSNVRVAFCSDRPLSFTVPSGQEAWSYYKATCSPSIEGADCRSDGQPIGRPLRNSGLAFVLTRVCLEQVMIPLAKIGSINPVITRVKPSEKYIQIFTIDGQDFWFMGFVNFEKASRHLSESMLDPVAHQDAIKPVVG